MRSREVDMVVTGTKPAADIAHAISQHVSADIRPPRSNNVSEK
jgi:hypothetical protein